MGSRFCKHNSHTLHTPHSPHSSTASPNPKTAQSRQQNKPKQACTELITNQTNKPLPNISMNELKKHKSTKSAWTSLKGVVYDITKYVKLHPGGVEKILKCCGKEGDLLFQIYHSKLDGEHMLRNHKVGYLIKDNSQPNTPKQNTKNHQPLNKK